MVEKKQNIEVVDKNSIEKIQYKEDTLYFKSADALDEFYGKKLDSLYKEKQKYLKIINKPQENVISIFDSLFFNLNRAKVLSAYKYLTIHHSTMKDMHVLFNLVGDFTYSTNEVHKIYDLFPQAEKISDFGKMIIYKIKERQQREEKEKISQNILDYKLIDESGNSFNINFLKSEYILLDFWASWCLPCRIQNKKLSKFITNEISSSKFTVVMISLDVSKEKWKRAILQDNLKFVNVSDMKGWNSPITRELRITSIPYNILITKSGRVVEHNLSIERLPQYITPK